MKITIHEYDEDGEHIHVTKTTDSGIGCSLACTVFFIWSGVVFALPFVALFYMLKR